MKPGRLIMLNGTSSAGKTSILNHLQMKLPGLYLFAGLDKFLNFLPETYFKQPLWNEVMGLSNKSGPLGDQLISGMHHSIKALLDQGHNVLADQVFIEQSWIVEAADLFCNYNAYLIGIYCPKAVIEQRERDRKNRTLGSSALQFDVVHKWLKYDFSLDSSLNTPEKNADLILEYFRQDPKPQAFSALCKKEQTHSFLVQN